MSAAAGHDASDLDAALALHGAVEPPDQHAARHARVASGADVAPRPRPCHLPEPWSAACWLAVPSSAGRTGRRS